MMSPPRRYAAIVPARGGSSRLPRKNVLPFVGRPLIVHSIEAGLACPLIDQVWVTTDNAEIAEIATAAGARIIARPPDLATGEALASDVVLHALDLIQGGGITDFVLLQPTSPLRTAHHVGECIQAFEKSGARCAISVTAAEHHPYKAFKLDQGALRPLFGTEYLQMPFQSLPAVYRQNGAIYVMGVNDFREEKAFYVDPAYAYVMSNEDSVDIDTEFDFKVASILLSERVSPA